ncbi:BON domain-containing protein [bacterium]|nr:BON domain-containing protein [Rhodospirillaceae bacterium]MDC3347026.1 BON domain-containing protein [bacterium]
MISIPSKIRSTVAIALISLLAACTQPTGLVNVASSPAEDRSFETLSADTAITFDINEILLGEKYRDLFAEISTDAYERVVLLTGTVKFAQNKQRATDLVRGVKGVKRIVNELQVTNDYGIGAAANDLWIETKLKVLLLGTKDIRSINYRWRSVNGTVYVIGAARSQQEMNTVLDVIRKTDRVKKVINHAWVRPPKAQ